ncbi:MAG: prolipoprotein diacylglyceryl transferase [Candidatus Moraniibacteriota bacterium]|nr:MAG: prolipoprotein diacylglyceryl transferase [Candidatus Moranbacteria bacterium]
MTFSLDPVAFSLGFFIVRWYSLMYIFGFLCVWGLISWRIKRGEITLFSQTILLDILLVGFLGGILGGRLGYILFYNPVFYWENPFEIIALFDHNGIYRGIFGMSFYGAILGSAFFFWVYCKKQKLDVWKSLDSIVPAVPIAIAFGRLGNFLNGELLGRESNIFWSVNFGDGIFRHPSQLYEMFFEGFFLFFLFFFFLRNKKFPPGVLSLLFLVGYGCMRFFVEFFRQPDIQIGFIFFHWLTMGQLLSLILFFLSLLGIIKIIKK